MPDNQILIGLCHHTRMSNSSSSFSADPLEVDATGLQCPLPVLRARRALEDLAPGATVLVRATDKAAVRDVPAFCEAAGHHLLAAEDTGEELRFVIRRGGLKAD